MPYVVGIDGGGTKTTCLFKPVSNNSLKAASNTQSVTGQGTNPHIIGYDEVKNRLQQLLLQGMKAFSVNPREIEAVCCGLAGVGRKEDEQRAEKVLKDIIPSLQFSESCKFRVCSDSYIALRGAMQPSETEGVLVISGTGSNALGMSRTGAIFKSGGWGHILGDEGSGYQIGLQALNKVTRAYDGRDKDTMLTRLILEKLQLQKVEELVSYIYGNKQEKKDIATFAELVIAASEQGDEISLEIIRQAAAELTNHVESLFLKNQDFNQQTPICTTGSIFKYSKLLTSSFREGLQQRKLGIYQEAYGSPVFGAAITAEELIHPFRK
ncbi:N-acetylglucosamine kinase [Sediminibacillus albus]|uniref:BadF-type ATPase n=1 Tax=Sediminibacillus albus TaxID=407036 RepID=A0A1G8YCU8_9BACI|nr:BadF/BadG/BcrA/BcrD ATPase family protein [Sediminibacillus albus]SDK00682.1 BadF-type ATPase [Sediminibacillus albus]